MEKEKATLKSFGAIERPISLAICCGCICKDYCIKNSASSLVKLQRLVREGKFEFPPDLEGLIKMD